MATDDIISSDDLEFIQRAEGLQKAFNKLRKAKTLILEARAEISSALGQSPAKTTRKTKKGAAPIEFGVDLPDTLTDAEKTVYAALKKGSARPRELVEATKLTASAVGRATRALAKRKLIVGSGATLTRTWKVK